VTKFEPGTQPTRTPTSKAATPSIDPTIFSGEPVVVLGGESFVEDARGVILARDSED
jgi:hypothetical protein